MKNFAAQLKMVVKIKLTYFMYLVARLNQLIVPYFRFFSKKNKQPSSRKIRLMMCSSNFKK